jgi:hypothetical protein
MFPAKLIIMLFSSRLGRRSTPAVLHSQQDDPYESETQPTSTSKGKRTSLNIPQRIERILARLNASGNVYRRWLVELASLAISTLCMTGIIIMLIHLQNKPLPSWSFSDPQTVVTVLAKISAAALIIPTSEAIGQLKWNWFNGKTSKEVYDFEIFDKASRGPWGSFMLLMVTKGKSLAALGAVLTLLMLAIDTFFQQLVSLPQRWEMSEVVRIPRVINYEAASRPFSRGGSEQVDLDIDMSAVVNKFLFDNGTQVATAGSIQTAGPVGCPTSNCTWPEHQTLGVCSTCEEVTQLLTWACLFSTFDWPSNVTDTEASSGPSKERNGTMCGYFMNATSAAPLLVSGHGTDRNHEEALLMRSIPLVTDAGRNVFFGGKSLNFPNIAYPLMDFIISSTPGGFDGVYRNETPIAYECTLYWCVKNITATFYEAAYTETTLNTFTNTTPVNDPWSSFSFKDPVFGDGVYWSYAGNLTIDTPSDRGALQFGVSNTTHIRTMYTLDTFLPAFTTAQNATARPVMRHDLWTVAPTLRVLPFNPWLEPRNIPGHMERMARAMSDVMRSTSSDSHINGTAWDPHMYVDVRWVYITYPLSLLVLSFVFLIATIKTSAEVENEVGVWKTSTMPTILYGLPQTVQDSVRTGHGAGMKIGRQGHSTRMKLLPNKGWRVSGCASAPTTPVLGQRRGSSSWTGR